ncbi:MAG: tRNA (adenosine(37)-N6)-threonylcarbamoyltransferase complex ATPase subunit type 1 TsaE [bacterium]|nr:tRNA (adenosine(37)-N6)-threonylcarbamoyltransferase complex ATPase subunit type 1 TsaE [bacterium]
MLTHSAEETLAWAESLAQRLRPGDVVCLSGELGAGKSVVARGIGKGLGVSEDILSPTFNYVLEYQGRLPLYHADLYRLHGVHDFVAMGLEEYFERDGVFVIEWPERITELLPAACYHIHLQLLDNPSDRAILLTEPAL